MIYKLGKLPVVRDNRNIKLSRIIRLELLPEFPSYYDIDIALGGVDDNRMFANDKYGDCVIAARAHQTLRFEKYEQVYLLPISDQDVVDEYFKETFGQDVGLVMLYSLKRWRKQGWKIGDHIYSIYAFAEVDWKEHDQVRHCIHLLGGVNFGMMVYEEDMRQFENGEVWHLNDAPGSLLGGHGVYLYRYGSAIGYDEDGVTCMTWGKRQHMTWDFWDARVDEAYGIVDDRDDWLGDNSPVDVQKLDGYLSEITGDKEEPSLCPVAKAYAIFGNFWAKRLHRKSRFPMPIIPK